MNGSRTGRIGDPAGLTIIVMVGLFAAAMRAWFVLGAIEVAAASTAPFETLDTPEYLHLARNIVERGTYVRADQLTSRAAGVVRPPGYPLFITPFLALGLWPHGVIWAQVPLGAAVCAMVALLGLKMFRPRHWPAVAAGLLSALSPTGIGLTALALADMLFTTLFLLAYLFTLRAALAPAASVARRAAAMAGILLAAAGLVKPSIMFWPFAGLLVWWLTAGRSFAQLRVSAVALFVAPPVLALGGWTMRNYLVEGLATPSAINARNLRMLVAPMVEEWARAGREPDRRAYLRNYRATSSRLNAFLASPDASIQGYVHMQLSESRQIIREHPGEALRVFGFNLKDQLITGWDLTDRQLYQSQRRPGGFFVGVPRPATEAIASSGHPVSQPSSVRTTAPFEGIPTSPPASGADAPGRWWPFDLLAAVSTSRPCQWVWAAVAAGSVLFFLTPRRLRDGDWSRRQGFAVGLWIVTLYFAALCGTAFRGGSRLMYPAEFAVILLTVSVVVNVVAILKSLWNSAISGTVIPGCHHP